MMSALLFRLFTVTVIQAVTNIDFSFKLSVQMVNSIVWKTFVSVVLGFIYVIIQTFWSAM